MKNLFLFSALLLALLLGYKGFKEIHVLYTAHFIVIAFFCSQIIHHDCGLILVFLFADVIGNKKKRNMKI